MSNNSIVLSNGVIMPHMIIGLPLINDHKGISYNVLEEVMEAAYESGIWGVDTSHDYGLSEEYIGKALKKLQSSGIYRDKVFITTKIGNRQQYEGDIELYVDQSLKTLQTDYLDAMLLHWPVPDLFVDNWHKLVKVYKKGKVKSIGIANALPRHFEKIKESGAEILPQILQTEIHPLHTSEEARNYCKRENMALQACTSLCQMISQLRQNVVLCDIANQHQLTVPQVVLRWHVQNKIAPVFCSFNQKHILETKVVWNIQLTQEEMLRIASINEDFRYHPESSNCAGF